MAQRLTARCLVAISRARDLFDSYWFSPTSATPITTTRNVTYPDLTAYVHKLPPEILYELLKYLEWRDLLNAGSVCRVWYEAMQSRQLWITLAMSLQLTHGIERMEEPIGDYTTAELRDWVLRRLRVQDALKKDTISLTFRTRQIKVPHLAHVERTVAIPGGRWLLSTDQSGRLLSYDLNHSEAKQRLLVDDLPNRLHQISYYVDYSRQKLSFRVALWQRKANENIDMSPTRIYQVDLIGHGEDAYLFAQLLAVVGTTNGVDTDDIYKFALGLSDEYLLELWEADNLRLSLHSYTKSGSVNSPSPDCVHFGFATHIIADDIYITPSNFVILVGYEIVEVYSMQQLQDSDEATRKNLTPLHRIPCASTYCAISYIFHETWLVFGHEEQMHLTRIPNGKGSSFATITLGQQALYPDALSIRTIFTPAAALILHSDWNMDFSLYSWDSEMNSSTFLHRRFPIPDLYAKYDVVYPKLNPIAIDNGVGRIVFETLGGDQFLVLDLTP